MNDLTCRDFIDFLMDYLDADLPQERRAVFEDHLTACPSCRAYLKNYESTVRMGRKALSCDGGEVPDSVPHDLVAAILAAKGEQAAAN